MNRDDIIGMAQKALVENDGADYYAYSDDLHWWGEIKDIERFAALIAAAEREACAKVCDARCTGDNNREDFEAKRCAEAIRARGKNEPT